MAGKNDFTGFVEAIEQLTDEDPKTVINILDCYHDLINESVYTFGDPIKIEGFGTFYYDPINTTMLFRSDYCIHNS